MKKLASLFLSVLLLLSMCTNALGVANDPVTQRLYDFVNAIDTQNWEAYMSYSSSQKYDGDFGFFTNPENEENHIGIYNVKDACLNEFYQVDLTEATKYTEYDLSVAPEKYAAFLVGIECQVYDETKYFSNGMNYFLILLTEENGEWKVAQFSSAALELLEYCNSSSSSNSRTNSNLSKAIENTQLRYYGYYINEDGNVIEYNGANSEMGTLAATEYTPPNTIRVYIKSLSSVRNINFTEYIQDVLPNEWIASWKADQCLRAGAMAVKTYSWYCVLHPDHPDLGADVTDDPEDNQHYVAGSNQERTNDAIRDTGGIGMQNSNSKIFRAEYRTGTSGNPGNQYGGKMSQYGSKYLAEQGYDFIEICDYYYSYSERSSGPIKTIVIGNA